MQNNDLDDDFPLNAGSEKLDRLFEESNLPDISFKYNVTKPQPRSKPPINIPLKVVCAKTVEAFQMKVSGYKSEGKVGIAIIGNDEVCYYQLYMYTSEEKKVTSVQIKFQFTFLIQQHNYASFRDSHNIQWSIHFDKPQDLIIFSKEVALARWKSEQVSQQKGALKSLVQEAFKGNSDVIVKEKDTVKVTYALSSLSPENILQEEESMKQAVVGPGDAMGVKLWGTSLVGACLKSKRFVICPGQLSNIPGVSLPKSYNVVLEMEIEDITPPASLNELIMNSSSNSSVDKKEESESLPGRMAKIGYALPSLQPSDTESSERPKTTSTKLTPNTSAQSLQSQSTIPHHHKEEVASLVEPCDVSTTSQFNVLFSEVRTNNSEIRMNINRVTDKVDSLLSKMDFVPQLNSEVIPTLKKIQNIDVVLNKLVEQNNAIMLHMEKNSPANLESAMNEVLQLKKRNSELEQFLEVSQSTSQILKDKVIELTEKAALSSSSCLNCISGKSVKKIEECVRDLEDRNSSLLEESEVLRRRNQQLNSQISLLQKETSENNMRCAELQEQVRSLNSKLINKTFTERNEIVNEDSIKSFINAIYRTLKEELKDMTIDQGRMEQKLSSVLKELTSKYLNPAESLPEALLSENRFQINDGLPQRLNSGNTPFSPSDTPLPVPRPRRPLQSGQVLIDSAQSTITAPEKSCNLEINLINDKENSIINEDNSLNNNKEDHEVDSSLISAINEKTDKIIETPSESNKSLLPTSSETTTLDTSPTSKNNVKPEFCSPPTENSNLVNSSSKADSSTKPIPVKSDTSSSYTGFSSGYYPPRFSTTPPPISDDDS